VRIKASSGRSKKDLRDHCEVLDIRADEESDATLLAALYRAIASGGRVMIETWDGERRDEIFRPRPARQCPGCKSGDVYPTRTESKDWEARCMDCAWIGLIEQTREGPGDG
jgi:hypothetical protein